MLIRMLELQSLTLKGIRGNKVSFGFIICVVFLAEFLRISVEVQRVKQPPVMPASCKRLVQILTVLLPVESLLMCPGKQQKRTRAQASAAMLELQIESWYSGFSLTLLHSHPFAPIWGVSQQIKGLSLSLSLLCFSVNLPFN